MLNIIGGVCLLLWGLRSVRNGMSRAFGADLHTVIAAGTTNRLKAFFAGVGVTALLQSSTATALIIAAFAGQGILSVSAGLAVMLGADVGTAVVAQILSFDLSWLAPLLIISGFILFKIYRRAGRLEHIGKLLIGLGLMLLALGWIRDSAEPLKDSEVLAAVLQSLERDWVLAILIAALLTWIVHSSLAVILLLVTLVAGGVLSSMLALIMVLGANLGGALVPVAVTLKDSREAARVPVGNLFMRSIGIVCVLPFMALVHDVLIGWHPDMPGRVLVDFHILFNLLLAVIFLPLTGPLAALCLKIIPDHHDGDDPGRARYLDEKELDTPAVALSAAMRETLRMAEVLESMMADTIAVLRDSNLALVHSLKERDDIIDSLYKEVKLYMAKITRESLDPDEALRYVQILGFATNLENAGDTIDKSLMEMAKKKIAGKMKFSDEGWAEIEAIHGAVLQNLKLAQSLFVSADADLARRLIEGKEALRLKEQRAADAHMDRIREGVPETISTSSLHLDIIRDLRRVNSYITTVSYAILEETGELRTSRLRKRKAN